MADILILASDCRTAHVILSSREEVIQLSKNLATWQTQEMAEAGTQAALVVEAKEHEVS